MTRNQGLSSKEARRKGAGNPWCRAARGFVVTRHRIGGGHESWPSPGMSPGPDNEIIEIWEATPKDKPTHWVKVGPETKG